MSAIPPPATPTRRRIWPRLVLALAAMGLTLLAAEIAYRLKLKAGVGNLPLGMSQSFVAANETAREPHEQWGYTPLPDRQLARLRVAQGQPVLYCPRQTNELGNFEPPKPNWRQADMRILVFGDSCTATAGEGPDGVCWPTLWETALAERLDRDVCVLNFGRDGYGVLQMLDLAQARCDEFAPDMIVFALIADDLTRQRLSPHAPQRDVPLEFVDADVTPEWCQAMLAAGGDADDPLLAKLVGRFDAACRHASPIDYFTPAHSFLYNRLAKRDPFAHLPHKRLNQRIDLHDFSDDPQCVAAIQGLLARQIPLAFVQLTTYEDIRGGSYQMSGQQQQLLRSLERLTGQPVLPLKTAFATKTPPEKLFLLPHDPHPSQAGLRLYSQAVDDALRDVIPKN
ncbi:MAG: SGNH/GDSL hydrolase family protein [Pirellulales bacterium]